MFEADCAGRLTFLAPDGALGWPLDALIGQPGAALLTEAAAVDPFRCTAPLRRQRVWLRTGDGGRVCMAVTTMPLTDEAGCPRGCRGTATDVTEQEADSAAAAALVRRGEVLDHVLARMRQEVLAPRMMQAVLESLIAAAGAEGAAVLSIDADGPGQPLYHHGGPVPELAPVLRGIVESGIEIRTNAAPDGAPLLAALCSTRFGEVAALVAWRAPGGRDWDEDDRILTGSVAALVRVVLEHESIQRELARQARTDPLTGLLNRRAFMSEIDRRLNRLESEGQPGTLLFIDLDRFKLLNDRHGHDAGDAALVQLAALLNRTFRPSDLVARLGGDEFAVWLDGADSMTAAERADRLCKAVPEEFAHLGSDEGGGLGVSIGIAMREPGSGEQLNQVMVRADQVMYAVKRGGGARWKVAQAVHV